MNQTGHPTGLQLFLLSLTFLATALLAGCSGGDSTPTVQKVTVYSDVLKSGTTYRVVAEEHFDHHSSEATCVAANNACSADIPLKSSVTEIIDIKVFEAKVLVAASSVNAVYLDPAKVKELHLNEFTTGRYIIGELNHIAASKQLPFGFVESKISEFFEVSPESLDLELAAYVMFDFLQRIDEVLGDTGLWNPEEADEQQALQDVWYNLNNFSDESEDDADVTIYPDNNPASPSAAKSAKKSSNADLLNELRSRLDNISRSFKVTTEMTDEQKNTVNTLEQYASKALGMLDSSYPGAATVVNVFLKAVANRTLVAQKTDPNQSVIDALRDGVIPELIKQRKYLIDTADNTRELVKIELANALLKQTETLNVDIQKLSFLDGYSDWRKNTVIYDFEGNKGYLTVRKDFNGIYPKDFKEGEFISAYFLNATGDNQYDRKIAIEGYFNDSRQALLITTIKTLTDKDTGFGIYLQVLTNKLLDAEREGIKNATDMQLLTQDLVKGRGVTVLSIAEQYFKALTYIITAKNMHKSMAYLVANDAPQNIKGKLAISQINDIALSRDRSYSAISASIDEFYDNRLKSLEELISGFSKHITDRTIIELTKTNTIFDEALLKLNADNQGICKITYWDGKNVGFDCIEDKTGKKYSSHFIGNVRKTCLSPIRLLNENASGTTSKYRYGCSTNLKRLPVDDMFPTNNWVAPKVISGGSAYMKTPLTVETIGLSLFVSLKDVENISTSIISKNTFAQPVENNSSRRNPTYLAFRDVANPRFITTSIAGYGTATGIVYPLQNSGFKDILTSHLRWNHNKDTYEFAQLYTLGFHYNQGYYGIGSSYDWLFAGSLGCVTSDCLMIHSARLGSYLKYDNSNQIMTLRALDGKVGVMYELSTNNMAFTPKFTLPLGDWTNSCQRDGAAYNNGWFKANCDDKWLILDYANTNNTNGCGVASKVKVSNGKLVCY